MKQKRRLNMYVCKLLLVCDAKASANSFIQASGTLQALLSHQLPQHLSAGMLPAPT